MLTHYKISGFNRGAKFYLNQFPILIQVVLIAKLPLCMFT